AAPIVPVAPGRFCTITFAFSSLPRPSATRRPIVSAAAPGGKGTTMVIVAPVSWSSGLCSAHAGVACINVERARAPDAEIMPIFFIVLIGGTKVLVRVTDVTLLKIHPYREKPLQSVRSTLR